jgi:hypothetical protein
MRCCADDEVLWPFGAALRGEAPNRLKLRWLKTVVVSVEEKAPKRRQVGTGKASVSEPVDDVSKQVGDIRTGAG